MLSTFQKRHFVMVRTEKFRDIGIGKTVPEASVQTLIR